MSMEQDSGQHAGKLGAGAIATLGGVAVLAIFMFQNVEDVTVEFLFWSSPGPSGCSSSWPQSSAPWCGSASACCAGTAGARNDAKTDGPERTRPRHLLETRYLDAPPSPAATGRGPGGSRELQRIPAT